MVLQEIKLGMTAAKLLKFIQLLSKQPDTKDLLTELGYIERLIAILKEKKPRKSSLRKKNWIGVSTLSLTSSSGLLLLSLKKK